jgi:hypothetical protein
MEQGKSECTINGIGKSRKYCTRRSSNDFQTASLLKHIPILTPDS